MPFARYAFLTHQKTQQHMAQVLRSICRLEQRSDCQFQRYAVTSKAWGLLHLVAEFPDRKPIELAGFVAVENFRGKKKNWPSMRVLTKVSERPRVTVLK